MKPPVQEWALLRLAHGPKALLPTVNETHIEEERITRKYRIMYARAIVDWRFIVGRFFIPELLCPRVRRIYSGFGCRKCFLIMVGVENGFCRVSMGKIFDYIYFRKKFLCSVVEDFF